MIFFKWLGLFVVIALLFQAFKAGKAGRALSRTIGGDEYEKLLSHHQSALRRAGLLTLFAVVVIELLVRTSPFPYALPWWFFEFHLACVVAFVLILAVIVFKYTGLANPAIHRQLVYPAFAFLGLIVLTGGIQLVLLPVG